MVYKWYILPIGWSYATHHLLREPKTTIEKRVNQSMRFAMNSSMGCLLWNYPNGSNLPPRCLLLRAAIAMAPSWWLPCVGWRPVWSRTGANRGRLWALRRCGKGGQRNVASCEGLPKGLHICICLYDFICKCIHIYIYIIEYYVYISLYL